MKRKINNIEIEIKKGNIADQPDLDVVVNAANAQLAPGGGVAGAIHSKAGPNLYAECRPLAPIAPGEAVITKGYGLPNKFVIHCLGPVYGRDKPEDKLLSSCYTNSIALAEKRSLTSIGFPAISTGIFGYPAHLAIDVVFKAVPAILPELEHVKKIRFVIFSEEDFHLYESILKELATE